MKNIHLLDLGTSTDSLNGVEMDLSSVTIAFSLLTGLYLMYNLVLYPRFISPLRNITGPNDHHFIFGQTLNQFLAGSPEEPFMTWMKKTPNEPFIHYFDFGHAEALLVNSVAAYKAVLHTHCYRFVRTNGFRKLVQDVIGVGLVFAEGSEHRAQRRVLGGLFTNANVKSYLPLLKDKASQLADQIEESRIHNEGKADVKELCSMNTLDVIGVFALGLELQNLDSPTEFFQCYKEMFDLSFWGTIAAAINLVVPFRWVPVAPNLAFTRASSHLRQILTNITKQRIQECTCESGPDKSLKPSAPNKDLLTYMIEKKYMAKFDRWDEEDLVEQVLNFMATGHETTASALTWALHVLGSHPHITNRLRIEISELKNRVADPSFSEIEGLHYLDNFMKELVRYYCPVAGIPRQAIESLTIEGVYIPKGTILMPIPGVIQHNPAIWGEDCDVFEPDRFDHLSGLAADPYAWSGFGAGPRACIGKALAILNFKTVVMELVSRFDFQVINKGKVEVVNPSGQLRPKEGMWLYVSCVQS